MSKWCSKGVWLERKRSLGLTVKSFGEIEIPVALEMKIVSEIFIVGPSRFAWRDSSGYCFRSAPVEASVRVFLARF